jgi:uncharacterized OB-fold protein
MSIVAVHRDADSAGFFDGSAEGTLMARRCENGHFMPPTQGYGPPVRCHVCSSPDIAWAPVSGKASLVTWVVIRARDGAVESVAGIVELEEGPWMQALLDVDAHDELRAGHPLTVTFMATGEAGGEGEKIPAFQLA